MSDKEFETYLVEKITGLEAEIAELQRKNSELEIELKAMRGAANSYKAEVERYEKTVGKLAVREDGTVVGLTIGEEVEYIPRDLAETFRKLAVKVACEQFMKKFKKYIKDVGLTLGQTWEINCALKRAFHELTERKEDE